MSEWSLFFGTEGSRVPSRGRTSTRPSTTCRHSLCKNLIRRVLLGREGLNVLRSLTLGLVEVNHYGLIPKAPGPERVVY